MKRLSDYQPSPYLIPSIQLIFDLDEQKTLVTSQLTIEPNPNFLGPHQPLELDGCHLELLYISLNGKILESNEYTLNSKTLKLQVPSKRCTLDIQCAINPSTNYRLEGLYLSQSLLCTQCEAEGFRCITYFIDRPDVLSKWSVTLRGDRKKYPFMLAGGDKVHHGNLADNRHEVKWVDPWPKPAYLFAIAAGPLFEIHDIYKTMSGRQVDLYLYCEPHNSHRLDFAMQSIKRAMQWDEENFGREYDLNCFQIVAVDSFNMGAMENKGLNIFNAQCLLAQTTATTDDEFRRIEAIIAHEYFHNWTGNRITCRDWFQLTLKEGLTVLRDQLFSSSFHSPGVVRLEQVQTLFLRQFPEDASAMAHPIQPRVYADINNFYTPTVYEKGAEVIRMMKTILGSRFRAGMDRYFLKHDGMAVTTEDFVKSLEEGSGVDLSTMRRWYTHYRTPHVYVTRTTNNSTGQLDLTIEQKPTPNIEGPSDPLCMPLLCALWDPHTHKKIHEDLLTLTTWSHTYHLQVPVDSLISINRGYSSPVIIHDDHCESERLLLASIDDDPIVRRISAEQLLKSDYQTFIDSGSLHKDGWLTFIKMTLEDSVLDAHVKSLLIRLPGPQEVLEWQSNLLIEQAIEFCDTIRGYVATALYDDLWKIYRENHRPHEYQFQEDFSARRHLKHSVMEYLICLQKPEVFSALWQQQQQAKCMSDEADAFRLLMLESNPYTEESIALYRSRWSQDNLTWPRWFLYQSNARSGDVLGRCENLFQDAHFNVKIPNQTRALIAGFSNNIRALHGYKQEDISKGYRWLADKIEHIDSFNPQLAAKLAKNFAILPRMTGARKIALHSVLQGLYEKSTVSTSTKEILARCLEISF